MKRAMLLLLLVAGCDQDYELRPLAAAPSPNCLDRGMDTFLVYEPDDELHETYMKKARRQAAKRGCEVDEELTDDQGVVICCP